MPDSMAIQRILEKEGEKYLPLLHYTLKRSNAGLVLSGDTGGELRRLRLAILVRNARLFNELTKLLEAFNSAGIETILLKGAMMEGIYPAGLRPFTDIDFMIRREKSRQVLEILGRLGYRLRVPPLRPGTEEFQSGMNYVKPGKLLMAVEPHLTLGAPYPYSGRLEAEGLWQRARRANIAGLDTLILSPEDSLLHACLHLLQHHRSGWLASSCDIVELIYHFKGELDWEAFLRRVFEFRLCLPVRYSLRIVSGLFEAPIPAFIVEQLGRYKPPRLEKYVFGLFTAPGEDGPGGMRMLASLLAMPGVRLKLRYLRAVLSPSREFMLSRYAVTDPARLPWYYVLRWRDSFAEALKTLSGIARNRLRF
jgi:hypothetical protein